MMLLKYSNTICSFMLILFAVYSVNAQGPGRSYYYDPATELPWAECYLYQPGGSQQKIPFLPTTDLGTRAPTGIGKYAEDVDVDAPLVFIGNGIVKDGAWNSYHGRRLDYTIGDIDVAGKVVLFCYDFPDHIETSMEEEIPVGNRIAESASRNAAAVILFSHQQDYPFVCINSRKESDIGNIPVISITRQSARNILTSADYYDGATVFEKWEESGKTLSMELISNIKIKIKGKFDRIDTKHFTIGFRKEVVPAEEMRRLSRTNEKALVFLFDCFKAFDPLRWEKLYIGYFRGYDEKTYYTRHWGHGLACDAGVFSVLRGAVVDYGTAVHENMHILTYMNWGHSSSFMVEGLGKFAEAKATDKDENHRRTLQYLIDGQLFPVEEMLEFNIGMPGLKTDVGYPASGSFIGFLADEFGLKLVIEVLKLEARSSKDKEEKDTWRQLFGKSVSELDDEWREWLRKRCLRYE